MEERLRQVLSQAAEKIVGKKIDVQLSRPDPKFGDFATNIALVLAKEQGENPTQIAETIKSELTEANVIEDVSIAGPGFINIRLSNSAISQATAESTELPQTYARQEILVEFGDPNPFKEMHIGHAYSYIVGDAISSVLEASGAKVHRLSYHGDVGLHVAKAIWAMEQEPLYRKEKNNPKQLTAELLTSIFKITTGEYYARGDKAYREDELAKREINEINRKVYLKNDEDINRLYDWGRARSLGYFSEHLKDLDVNTPRQYFESEAAAEGEKIVRENLGEVFAHSGNTKTIIFPVAAGSKGLHTRVFITAEDLPTYEAKELGLAKLKEKDFLDAKQSLIITAHEQADYFKVVLAALSKIDKSLANMTKHLYHGFVSLSSGKMSSRTGNVYKALSLISDVSHGVEEAFGQKNQSIRNAAIKYGFLKHRLGSDIVYDVAESISLEGNSGPYLQYAHARAASILAKVQNAQLADNFDEYERSLALKVGQYPEVLAKATTELMPHHICTYLYELCQEFNRFYEHCRVAGDARETHRAGLVKAYKDVLASGLGVLNIEAPDKV